jgi:hypothetical protein
MVKVGAVVSFEQIVEVVLDDAVAAALDEASRAGLPLCEACLSALLARRMVHDVFPALRADYRRERPLTLDQVRNLVEDTGRDAAHLSTMSPEYPTTKPI